MSEFLEFVREVESERGSTQIWQVNSKRHGFLLGYIRWHGAWRQYVFWPGQETLFNNGCLADIQGFIGELMAARRTPSSKKVAVSAAGRRTS